MDAIKLIRETTDLGARLRPACECLCITLRTFQRWSDECKEDQRKGPKSAPSNKLSEIEIKKVLSIANSPEFRDKSPTQIVPMLADKGTYVASESSFYRILKAYDQVNHRGSSKPREHSRPKELVATQPNHVWSWDITFLQTNVVGLYFYLYLVMDIYSRKIVGFEISKTQSSEMAARMIQNICLVEGVRSSQLTLHSDNGSPMKGATMLATLQKLGVMPSFSRPSVSDDNSYSESLFKTLKYCPKYPSKPFESMEQAIAWVDSFVNWYNNEHLHSGIKFVTPASRHEGADKNILKNRNVVYEIAKKRHPERWSRDTRNWEHIGEVRLNSLQKDMNLVNKKQA